MAKERKKRLISWMFREKDNSSEEEIKDIKTDKKKKKSKSEIKVPLKDKKIPAKKKNDSIKEDKDIVKDKEEIFKPKKVKVSEKEKDKLKEKKKSKKEKKQSPIEFDPFRDIFPGAVEIDEIDEINLKDEFKDSVEIYIIEEIKSMLDRDYKDIEELEFKIKLIQEQQEKEVLALEVEKLKVELEKIIEEFEEIKKHYNSIYKNMTFKEFEDLKEFYLEDLIGDYRYKKLEDLNEKSIIEQIIEIKEYIDVIDKIIDVENHKDTVTEEIDEKIDNYKERDKEFDEFQTDYEKIEKFNKELDSINDEIRILVMDLRDKVNDAFKVVRETNVVKKIVVTQKVVKDINKIIAAILIFNATSTIPNSRRNNMFKGVLLATAMYNIATAFKLKKEEKEITEIKEVKRIEVTDYSKEIKYGLENIDDVIYTIDDALKDIDELSETFDYLFSEYQSSIPEYDDMFKNILKVKEELEDQKNRTLIYGKDLEYSFAKNKVKTSN